MIRVGFGGRVVGMGWGWGDVIQDSVERGGGGLKMGVEGKGEGWRVYRGRNISLGRGEGAGGRTRGERYAMRARSMRGK